ncbi:MAG: bifunctional diguanylate cyclase/phosphodiesterase [Candidatus Dormiibacterota bacterium]
MFSALPLARRGADLGGQRRGPGLIWTVYGLLGLVLIAFYLSQALVPRAAETVVDEWPPVGFEFVAALLCIGLGLARPRDRTIPVVLGLAVLSWATGDAVLTATPQGHSPQLADVFYLLFYPTAYVGLVLILRREAGRLVPATWLDGITAGLGAAAVCGAFLFHPIAASLGHQPMAVAVNLAYPVGDVLLLALVIGATATFPGRPKVQWLVLATACGVVAIGDSFNLVQLHQSSPLGTVANSVAWPTTIFLISAAMLVRPGPTNLLAPQRTPGFLLPGLGTFCGLAILFFGTMHHVTPVALGLASATLVTASVRAGLSVRRLRTLTDERQRQSVTDHLTGLGNRRHLFNVLDAYFADRRDPRTPDVSLAFLFVDLDHFKEINDSFGHSAGDSLLRQLGPRLKVALRSTDVLVRVGGDELGVIVTGGDADYAVKVAERILDRLSAPFHLDAVSVRISASIGIAIAPRDAQESVGLLRCADLAMYRAKLSGVPFEMYDSEIDDEGNRLRLVDELRVAVEAGDFALHYQPQLNLRTRMVTTVEALLRWTHPRLGAVPPLDFLPLAEEAGLMRALTTIVLDKALTQCAAWRASGHDLAVSVNISITNLLDAEFIALVQEQLLSHQVPATYLILEITETTIVRDFERCKSVIAELRGLGLGISVDDFGAGFTSLAYLGNLAVSELKLDRSFITGLGTGQATDAALVRATIDLGHALGLRVVAEGIEDNATLTVLTGMGCDLAQGYFIGRPVPADQLTERPGFGTGEQVLAGLRAS